MNNTEDLTTRMRTVMTKEGQKIGRYLLTKMLGKGQYGSVWLARHLDSGHLFAIKKVSRASVDRSQIHKRLLNTEITIMHEINHPNIMHLYDYLVSSNNYYLVIQYCNQGDLEHYMAEKKVTAFEETDAVYFLKQIINGFWELRKHKILHRDFKLANIFVHNEQLVIGDFGFAKMGQDVGETQLGSPLTMAPELLFSNGEKLLYNSKADLWSIGVVFYQMLFGKPPFWGKNVAELKKSIQANSGEQTKFTKTVSNEAKDLIRRLLTMDPHRRIEWREFFNHPLFNQRQQEYQSEVRRVFGPAGLKASLVAATEFDKNKNTLQSEKEIQFYDEEQFANLDKAMSQKNIEEEQIDESNEDRMLNEAILAEVCFRYGHEVNKVYFLIYSVHRLQAMLKETAFPTATQQLMNLSALVLKKALVLNERLGRALAARTNLFGLHASAFKIFMASEKAQEVVRSVAEIGQGASDHFGLLLNRFKTNRLQLAYSDLTAPGIDEKTINKYILAEAGKLKAMNLAFGSGTSQQATTTRKFYLLLVIVKYVMNLDGFFPYLQGQSADPKFNWNGFYYTLERATNNELKILI